MKGITIAMWSGPRSLSTALQTQVSSTATKTAFLVELNLSSTVRLTDYYIDLELLHFLLF